MRNLTPLHSQAVALSCDVDSQFARWCLQAYTADMEHIGGNLATIEETIRINSSDPVARYGFTQMPNFILRHRAISTNAKTVYALIISYAWHNNRCFPGQDRLADDMGLSRPSVTAAIKELEAFGLLDIERRGLGKTNIYTINFAIKTKPNPPRGSGANRLKSAG